MTAPDFLILHGTGSSVVLERTGDGAPLWRYWGPRLADGIDPGPALSSARPLPSFSLDTDQPLSIFPGFGVGWFGQAALLAHRNGEDWTFAATSCRIEQSDPQGAEITLTDDIAGIDICVRLHLDPASDVVTFSNRLTNNRAGRLDVQWLAAATLPLPADAQIVRSWTGRHNSEFVEMNEPLARGQWRRENRRGITSHDCFPGALVFGSSAVTYGVQLAWSGNHVQSIEWMGDGRFHWQMGEWLAPGEVRLAEGESIETPELLATCSVAGADGVAQNFHTAIRKRIVWPGGSMRPRPVHLNTWEGFYFDHDLDALFNLADRAADVGIERFVLDDGWFQGRDDDTSSLGDWLPDARKYPDGLAPLANHVVKLGMEFGLWVEPEMVNPDSDLFRAHPDWSLQTAGRPLITGRNQLVLDLTQDAVSNYLFDALSGLLSALPISYLKWDHNRDLTTAGRTPLYRRQVFATYRLMSRLRAAFPDVEIESCAGGGGRIDAGIIRHTHRFWTSDCIDAVSRVSIQRGFLQFMPPELMGSHIGTSPAHTTGRKQSMMFRAGVALPGHLGVELDLRFIDAEDRDALKAMIANYKMHRDRLHAGRLWQGDAGDGVVWQAHGEPDDLLLLVYRVEPTQQAYPPCLRLEMLDRSKRYRIVDDDNAETIFEGAWLATSGLPLPAMKAERFLLYAAKAL
jgi:alpha-galactosidase